MKNFSLKLIAVLLATLFGSALLADGVDTGIAELEGVGIEPQPLNKALETFADRSGLQVIYLADVATGVETRGAAADLSDNETLDQLLASTGLEYEYLNEHTVTVQTEEDSQPGKFRPMSSSLLMAQNETSEMENRESDEEEEKERAVEEIFVTGTHIRGAHSDSSPLFVFDAEEIRLSGALTTEQFFHTLPQNLNSLVSSAAGALGGAGEFNRESINSIDLRGLGVGTTLILMNGRRIAPSSRGRAPDVSLIPLAAIDRVEVLTDGASAIYGSDAVGGVVNFVLRDQFDGAETTIGYGSVTDGNHSQIRFDQIFGSSWNHGNGLISYSYLDQSDLDAADRNYALAAAPFSLIPEDSRHNVLATITQEFGAYDVSADFLFSKRDTKSNVSQTAGGVDRLLVFDNDQEQFFGNVELSREINDRLYIDGVVSFSTADFTGDRAIFDTSAGDDFSESTDDTESIEGTITVGGSLLNTPSGEVKYAVGVGYNSDELTRARTSTTVTTLDRDTKYVFAELLIPFVQPSQNISGLNRLELSLANRYTDYSDFGSNNSPKVGVLWSPVDGLNLRGTFAESFRAPFLFQTNANNQQFSLFSLALFGFPDPFSTDNSSVMFFVQGTGNSNLQPEEAKSYTAGLDISPAAAPGLTISATYYDIEYTDQIAVGDPSGGFAAIFSPADFPDLFILDPSEEYIASVIATGIPITITEPVDVTDPAAIAAIANVALDNRIRNLSLSDISGVDLTFAYERSIENGQIEIGGDVAHVLDSVQRITATSPENTLVNTLLNPADMKLKAYVGYSSGGISVRGNINYVDGYSNPFSVDNPDIDSWTTFDIAAAYSFSETDGFFSDVRLSLNLRNLFDEDPPFVDQSDVTNTGLNEPVGFDPANASPLGRFVSFEINKSW